MNLIKILLLSTALLTISCAGNNAPLTVDGTNAQTTEASLNKINKRLSDKKRLELTVALLRIQFSEAKSAFDVITPGQTSITTNYNYLGSKLDGLTYKQILELAESSPTKAEIHQ
jgi:hypothetical protein